MPELRAARGRHTWAVRVGPRFEHQGRLVLAQVMEPDGEGLPLFGWPLEVRIEPDGTRRVLGPAPLCTPRDDLTPLLALLTLQLSAARRLGVEPIAVHPDDLVHVAPGALEHEAVMLARQPQPDPGDSGWHVRPDGPRVPYPDPYDTLTVVELLEARKALAWPLALPPGLLVRLRGDDIVSVRDGEDRERW